MILKDQPACFPDSVLVKVSSKNDGTVLDRTKEVHAADALVNRSEFCKKVGVPYDQVVYQQIIYGDEQTYSKIARVDGNHVSSTVPGIKADALFTTTPGVGLFLPVADCVATVFYDTRRKELALAHIGRHASYAKLATRVVEQFVANGSNLNDVTVWMSPHAGKDSYKLEWFDRQDDPDWSDFYTHKPDGFYLDMAGYNKALLVKSGINEANIFVSPVDTASDDNYFSHSSGDVAGRIAVLAMIKQ